MTGSVPADEVAALAAALAARLERLEPYPDDRFAGDGIVVCAGGASIFTNAYVLIHVLRCMLGCTLPIEVWHLGASEMSARMRVLLRDLSAEPVDAEPIMAARGVELHDGWQLKSVALRESSFVRVLLLDADIVPERDPAELFAWPEFKATGAVLWPDICSLTTDNQIWAACGLAPRTTRALESGQVLIDKARHWDALQIIEFLNLQSRYYYRIVYGDKDLFLIGFLVTGGRFSLVPHVPFTDQPFCLFQRDFAGVRLFQHRTGAKWRFRSEQIAVSGFRYAEACEAALQALRQAWNGRVFQAPARAPAALAEESRLAGIGWVSLLMPGEAAAHIRLLAGGEIIGSGKLGLLHWYCSNDVSGDVDLVLQDRFERTTRFTCEDAGCWVQVGSTSANSIVLERREPPGTEPSAAPNKDVDLDPSRYRFDGDP